MLPWSRLHGGLLGGALRKSAEGRAVKSARRRATAALAGMRRTGPAGRTSHR
ncbi:hypothetical protein ACIQAD_23115 [Streptomyces sp. NPDC088551]|uniref:hypothetical protein n=1 Tax=Streptomyces sp. NPDC088551 TaxID=3365863 RepID=UPI00380B7BEE